MVKQALIKWWPVLLILVAQASMAKTYTFGVVPQQSASKLAQLWTPIVLHLSEQTGMEIQFATAPNIPTFEERLAAGDYDFVYMNPYHFTVFNQEPGYQALAKAKNKRIKGIIVVRKDSGITELQQLNRQTLAFPAPAAFAASILTRSHLSDIGINFTPKYVSSHDSVYSAVAKGLYPAGGGVMRTFNNMPDTLRKQLHVLWTTQGYTPHAFASHPKVNAVDQLKLQQALIQMDRSLNGMALLESIKLQGIEAAQSSDWDDVRRLRIEFLGDQGHPLAE
ncbi:phosphate/phosphite/phosphonate ABC transporter substrate-binding protein [Photobacterium lipolyticum]|uniref:Phosphate ABC transporter substrate-binding protein n=1 Tax=Photobacterium lipolyticum TaxID=266810 RepID=A0A2T3N0S7_9GAMM|nr:phosphate/phosphite/phosphonate ABC transporter substrate-binding protein [Photobacterium lipolyticum]PSW05746.1 phosphate ABC transporter substrate-binding protein [Photobacterium lipolyticum]